MFTLYLKMNTTEFPASRLCLLQFAMALSIVKAIKEAPLELKWPNDIFYDKLFKICGVLVKSSMLGQLQNVKIGVGFNLNNEHPSGECLNSKLRKLNRREWQPEEFVAKVLNEFEAVIHELSVCRSLDRFLDDYKAHWIHKNQRVFVEQLNEEAEMIGINEYGYLRVRKLSDQSEHDLQPDGNRFDMTQNLILLR